MADPKPIDAWEADMRHTFLFALRPKVDEGRSATPFALFTMSWEVDGPVAALAITPDAAGAAADVVDLSRPGLAYTVPLAAD